MSTQDFNELVDLAMQDSALALMRPVVEKELLHYEIFAALDGAKQLKHLVDCHFRRQGARFGIATFGILLG